MALVDFEQTIPENELSMCVSYQTAGKTTNYGNQCSSSHFLPLSPSHTYFRAVDSSVWDASTALQCHMIKHSALDIWFRSIWTPWNNFNLVHIPIIRVYFCRLMSPSHKGTWILAKNAPINSSSLRVGFITVSPKDVFHFPNPCAPGSIPDSIWNHEDVCFLENMALLKS